ncbi:hypothetical protein MNV49_000250 [Pseudohyphozyma bogoriensis]|nr:hypothetical protein MNV49_000250 [Pseudohyphozyma bogoriensis]
MPPRTLWNEQENRVLLELCERREPVNAAWDGVANELSQQTGKYRTAEACKAHFHALTCDPHMWISSNPASQVTSTSAQSTSLESAPASSRYQPGSSGSIQSRIPRSKVEVLDKALQVADKWAGIVRDVITELQRPNTE